MCARCEIGKRRNTATHLSMHSIVCGCKIRGTQHWLTNDSILFFPRYFSASSLSLSPFRMDAANFRFHNETAIIIIKRATKSVTLTIDSTLIAFFLLLLALFAFNWAEESRLMSEMHFTRNQNMRATTNLEQQNTEKKHSHRFHSISKNSFFPFDLCLIISTRSSCKTMDRKHYKDSRIKDSFERNMNRNA